LRRFGRYCGLGGRWGRGFTDGDGQVLQTGGGLVIDRCGLLGRADAFG
jgi:hypothetical protein